MSKCCEEHKSCSNCPLCVNEWSHIPILKGIRVCKKEPEAPEILIFSDDSAKIRDVYKKCFAELLRKSESQDIHHLEQKRIDREPLTEGEKTLLALWDTYADSRKEVPPLENIAIEESENRDIQRILYAFFDAAGKLLCE